MVKRKVLPEDFLDHICEDLGLETLLEINDIEPREVIELLIAEGLIDVDNLCVELPEDDD